MNEMKFEDLVNLIAQSHNSESQAAVKHIRSYQYQLSLKILAARIKNKLTVREAAKRVGLSLAAYESFENGTNKVATKDEYEEILGRLHLTIPYVVVDSPLTAKNLAYIQDGDMSEVYPRINSHNEHYYNYRASQIDNVKETGAKDETKIPRLFNKEHELSNERFSFAF